MQRLNSIELLRSKLAEQPRYSLAQLPTPLHRLKNFGQHLGGPELWIKRDDLTGLEGGGNKTRKLEFLVGEAIRSGADMLVTAGAIQSNHTDKQLLRRRLRTSNVRCCTSLGQMTLVRSIDPAAIYY